jgi:hypothetical protein
MFDSLPDSDKIEEIIDQWNNCPACDSIVFDIINRICYWWWCDYDINHLTIISNKKAILDNNNCSCWMPMWNWSRMCKECYDKNKVSHNF